MTWHPFLPFVLTFTFVAVLVASKYLPGLSDSGLFAVYIGAPILGLVIYVELSEYTRRDA